MPRRGTPGLVRGPVALHCCGRPHAGHPVHRYAVRGCAGWVRGGEKCPPHWRLSPRRRGTQSAPLIGTPSPHPRRGARTFLSAAGLGTSILLSPPPSPLLSPCPRPATLGRFCLRFRSPGMPDVPGEALFGRRFVCWGVCVSVMVMVYIFACVLCRGTKAGYSFRQITWKLKLGLRSGGGARPGQEVAAAGGAKLGLAGCLHPSPRVGLLRLLGLRRTWARAPCALSGEVRVATRVSSVSSDKRTVTSPS